MLNVFRDLHTKTSCYFLFTILLVFILLRLPSLSEPYWYGDEGIYQVIGDALNNGRILYKEIWDNKPPLLYAFYALLGADQFLVRLASLFFGVFSVITFYALSRELFKKERATVISTMLFALLFALPFTEANIANAENFMLLPILLAALFIFRVGNVWVEKDVSHKRFATPLFVAGMLLGLSFLIKIVAIFDTAAFLLFLIFIALHKKHPTHQVLRSVLPVISGFALPVAISFLTFTFQGAFNDYMQAAFLSNVGYVGYHNVLLIPQGFLLFKVVILLGFLAFLYKIQKRLTVPLFFISLWLGFSLFDTFFSQRPYTHYVLMSIVPVSFIFGSIFDLKKERKFALALFVISTVLLVSVFKLHRLNKVIPYYSNYIQFLTNQKDVTSYQAFFDGNTPRDYEVALYLKSQLDNSDVVFIWGNTAQIYRLADTLPAGRYTVSYHIGEKQLSETRKALENEKPKFFVVLGNQDLPPLSLGAYQYKLTIKDTAIYERTN